jgi:hypothetical protein
VFDSGVLDLKIRSKIKRVTRATLRIG